MKEKISKLNTKQKDPSEGYVIQVDIKVCLLPWKSEARETGSSLHDG